MRAISRRVSSHALRRLAIEIGAPVLDTVLTAALNLGVWPPWFRPPASDDPPRSHMCGFVFDHTGKSQPLPPNLEAFLTGGDPPVIAAFGSAASLHASPRYRAVADACARLGRRCLLIGPSADLTIGPSTHLMTVASAPYASVFPYASVIVHHGGFGTCGETLRAGKPSLVTPFAFDQFDTAARLHDAHLGHWMRNDASNVDLLTSALDSTLRDAALVTAARDAAMKIATAPGGADHAASLITSI
jgi:UDP:flavonoid glycosyltransferase YjiC (YdhE family)